MAYHTIHKALTQSLVDLSLSVTIAYENRDFDPSDPVVAQFIDVTLLPASVDVISKDTLDEELGIYQLSIYTKSGTDTKTAYQLADTLEAFYRHGVTLTSGSQKVFIDRMHRGPGRNDNGWYIIDCSINYTADLLR